MLNTRGGQVGVNGGFKDGNAGAPWGTRARTKEREGGQWKVFAKTGVSLHLRCAGGESLEQTATSSRRHRYISSFLQPSSALPPRRSRPPRHFEVLFASVA